MLSKLNTHSTSKNGNILSLLDNGVENTSLTGGITLVNGGSGSITQNNNGISSTAAYANTNTATINNPIDSEGYSKLFVRFTPSNAINSNQPIPGLYVTINNTNSNGVALQSLYVINNSPNNIICSDITDLNSITIKISHATQATVLITDIWLE